MARRMQAGNLQVNRFAAEDPAGPYDAWLDDAVIPDPSAQTGPLRVALICVWFGPLPPYMDYFTRAASFSQDKGWLAGVAVSCRPYPGRD